METFTGQKKMIAQFKYCCIIVMKIHSKRAVMSKAAYTVMKRMRRFSLRVFK
jgi:DNA-binding FrmR family transcriptional regulator